MKRDTDLIIASIQSLYLWIKKNRYYGWDPYDWTISPIFSKIPNNMLKYIFFHIGVYSPINFRPVLRIPKKRSVKSLALLSQAFTILYELTHEENFKIDSEKIVFYILKSKLKTDNGYAWETGYYSPYIPQKTPAIVVTLESLNSLIGIYKIIKNQKIFSVIKDVMRSIINDFTEMYRKYFYIKYTPIDKNKIVFNVSGLGLSMFSKYLSNIEENPTLINIGNSIAEMLTFFQNKNGSWPYSYYFSSGKFKKQLDYHQGFIIDGLVEFLPYINDNKLKKRMLKAIKKGVYFYKNKQFTKDGTSYYRYPWKYPIDIHNQAQGIITFSKLYKTFGNIEYLKFAKKIAMWTIKNMQDPSGYFYTHRWPFMINKIPYMRWGQAWMLLALSSLLKELKEGKE